MNPTQLPLGISVQDQCTFDNFFLGPNRAVILEIISALDNTDFSCISLWGKPQVGKSHCLQAACHHLAKRAGTICYLPLKQIELKSSEIFYGLEAMNLVCIDDIDVILGKPDWEQALFSLFNQMRDKKNKLIFSANNNIDQLNIKLADLRSRLKWDSVLCIQELDDTEKTQALQLRCKNRGIELPSESAEYLLKRREREMGALYELIEALTLEAISEKRRLTIPFIRDRI